MVCEGVMIIGELRAKTVHVANCFCTKRPSWTTIYILAYLCMGDVMGDTVYCCRHDTPYIACKCFDDLYVIICNSMKSHPHISLYVMYIIYKSMNEMQLVQYVIIVFVYMY